MIGKTISHYKILEELGRGGMGEVYLAQDTELDRKVALKFLPSHFIIDEEVKSLFKREAKTAAALNHPNIVTVYEIGEYEGNSFIAMEYVKGESLRDLLTREELPIGRVLEIAGQICEGLGEAHQAGIVHRDVKPENILLDEKGRVKIADFGLAKVKNASKKTRASSTMGTLRYMSPEQLQSADVDQRSDIYSVGVVLYEMITGRLPFKGEYEAAITYSILNESPEPLARYKSGVSEELQRIVSKAIDKDRDMRYVHIDDLLTDLKREARSTADAAKPLVHVKAEKRMPNRATILTVALSFLAVLVAFITIKTLQNDITTKKVLPNFKQVTRVGNVCIESGNMEMSAISPDGKSIAYVVPNDSTKSVMVQDFSGGKAREVCTCINNWILRWFPDGTKISFYDIRPETASICVLVPRQEGPKQKIDTYHIFCWSPDGSRTASIHMTRKQILLSNMKTGEIDTIFVEDFKLMEEIDWAPVGNRLLIYNEDLDKGKHAIWTIKLDGTERQKIFEDDEPLYTPRWSLDGEAIYFMRSHGQKRDLMKICISSDNGKAKGKAKVLLPGLQAYGFSLSDDNKILCYTKYEPYASNLWLVTAVGEGDNKTPQLKKLTEGTRFLINPQISPDGNKVTYSNGQNIFVMTINGENVTPLTTFDSGTTGSPCWGPDGQKIAFGRNGKVWYVTSDGNTRREFKNTRLSSGISLTWAPGTDILYKRPGNRNFHFLDPETEEEWPLVEDESVGWLFQPRYNPDGGEIVIGSNREVGNEEDGLYLISMKNSSEEFLYQGTFRPIYWSADGEWIYAWNYNESSPNILRIPAHGGEPEILTTLPFNKITNRNITMTADGKHIICSVVESVSDVWLIENFDPDVK